MGNVSGGNRRGHQLPSQPETSSAASSQYPNPNPQPPLQYYEYQGYYPPIQSPYFNQGPHRVPSGSIAPPSLPYVEHQKAVTIRNDINLNKQTLRFEPDQLNPGNLFVSFTFDATVSGSITVMFFAKEGEECDLIATKEHLFPSSTLSFIQGHGQRFKQLCGTGTGFSETDLVEASQADVYHLAVKAESAEYNPEFGTPNRQITLAVLEKEKGEYKARVVKQVLWVNGNKYVLQEIYGIGNSLDVEGDDGNETGKECVICLTEPQDTTLLPCRHMCMCSGCAKLLRFQTNLCPICRQPVDRLLEIKVNTNGANH